VTGSGGLLAAVCAVAWVAVWLVTQLAVSPPLSTGRTLLVGAAITTLLILGFPSVLRGPRLSRSTAGRTRRGPAASAPPVDPRVRRRLRRRPRSGPEAATPVAAFGRSMPLRSGLTAEAADRTVKVLRPVLGGHAVGITDTEQVLAYVGPGSDHHHPNAAPMTAATKWVLDNGRATVLTAKQALGCPHPGCPLQSAAIAPLMIGRRVVGALKVYRVDDVPPELPQVEGVANILSLHLELAELDREHQLAADAKLDALRAQINPHFLFNTLNTIASKARTDPEEARRLLLRLSDFFRYSIRQDGHFADFAQEYFFVRTYLALEQARYGERLSARFDVDPQVLTAQVPVLTIQPLVENAVKHGLAEKVDGGTVTLKARVDPLTRTTMIQVRDDGVGMSPELTADVVAGAAPSGGIGLRNISQRLASLFGDRYTLDVRSSEGSGTIVDLRIPLR
jgi:LytS/YehU family sensor histidine kinase